MGGSVDGWYEAPHAHLFQNGLTPAPSLSNTGLIYDGSHAWAFMQCGRHLEILNTLIFGFVFL